MIHIDKNGKDPNNDYFSKLFDNAIHSLYENYKKGLIPYEECKELHDTARALLLKHLEAKRMVFDHFETIDKLNISVLGEK